MTLTAASGSKTLRRAGAFLLGAAALGWGARTAEATTIERIVAVIEEQAILLSDLRARARPYLGQLPSGQDAQRAAAISQLMNTLLNRMVDEELEHRAAAAAKITVTAAEVEDALGRVAQQNKVSVEDLMTEAQKTGLDARQYREEIRRQLLEAKLLNLKVQGRIRVSDEDLKTSYQRLVTEERRTLTFRAAWVRVGTAAGASSKEIEAKQQLAAAIAKQAKGGEDFSRLARSYSDDAKTREKGGLLESMRPGSLPLEIDKALLALDVGEVTAPLRYGGDFYVVKLIERDASQLPPFAEAQNELQNRVYMEKMERAKRHWLDGLRKQAHVDMRL